MNNSEKKQKRRNRNIVIFLKTGITMFILSVFIIGKQKTHEPKIDQIYRDNKQIHIRYYMQEFHCAFSKLVYFNEKDSPVTH